MECDPRHPVDPGRSRRCACARTASDRPPPRSSMIALLDTHIIVWWFERSTRLSRAQQRMLARTRDDHPLGVTDTSLWEIALLVEAGRVRLALPIDEWLARATAAPR